MSLHPSGELRLLSEVDARYRRGRLIFIAAVLLGLLVVGYAWMRLELSLGQIIGGVDNLGGLILRFFPPDPAGQLDRILRGLVETLAIAFLGTLLAALVAIPISLFAARNVIETWLLRFSVKRLFDLNRSVDTLIWALICVGVVGLGPLAGVLAIMMADIGTLAKLFSEAIDDVDRDQAEGIRAAGGTRAEIVMHGYAPQVIPIFLTNILYFFESNVRSASAIGIVGAGGIGHLLSERIRSGFWQDVSFILILIIITVALVDWLSRAIRTRLIADPRLES